MSTDVEEHGKDDAMITALLEFIEKASSYPPVFTLVQPGQHETLVEVPELNELQSKLGSQKTTILKTNVIFALLDSRQKMILSKNKTVF